MKILLIMLNFILICDIGAVKSTLQKPEHIHVFFISDNNFAKHTAASISSILSTSEPNDVLHFYIVDIDISEKNKNKFQQLKTIKTCEIEFIKADKELVKHIYFAPKNKLIYGDKTVFYRYFVPYMKPNLKKALYIDGDIIAFQSLKNLWNTNIDEVYLAAVRDFSLSQKYIKYLFGAKYIENMQYFNAGVLLMNLEKMRKDKLPEKLLNISCDILKDTKICLADQDMINYLCFDKMKYINYRYNFQNGLLVLPNFMTSIAEVIFKKNNKWKAEAISYEGSIAGDFLQANASYINEAENVVLYHYEGLLKPWTWSGYFCNYSVMKIKYFEALMKTNFSEFADYIHYALNSIVYFVKIYFLNFCDTFILFILNIFDNINMLFP